MTNLIEDILPLTPLQQGMLYHSVQAPESGIYFEQAAWIITGHLDVQAFQNAWKQVIARHAALRAAFLWQGMDEPVQVISKEVDLPFSFHDWSSISESRLDEKLQEYLAADRQAGFDPALAPLMRLALIQCTADRLVFVWSHHHLLLDGWSQPVLLGEFFLLYNAVRQGETVYLPAPFPYQRYIAWLKQQDPAAAERAWRAELAGFPAPNLLHFGFPDREGVYAVQKCALPESTSQALHHLARERGITLNTLMQGVWGLLLSRYTRETDVVFGAAVSGRPASLPGAENLVGLLINTLPVRVQVPADTPVMEWLRAIQAHQASLREYEYTALMDIHAWSEVPREMPLFESILVFENYPENPLGEGKLGDLQIQELEPFSRTNYPLTIAVSPGKPVGLLAAYETARFNGETIEQMLGHFQHLLESIVADPDAPVGLLSLITEREKQQILEKWSRVPGDANLSRTALDLFVEQAHRDPFAPALHYQGSVLSYEDLDRRSNQLAHYLVKIGVVGGQIVGMALPPSPELLIAILGILKAGAAYLPLDPGYPTDRLAFMVEDSGMQVLLTLAGLVDKLPAGSCEVVRLDTDWPAVAELPETAPEISVFPADLAYVIYTSGTTGRPKGSLLLHRGLSNLVQNLGALYRLGPGSRMLQFLSISFDASVSEIFPPLAHGAALVMAPREVLASPPELTGLLNREAVTHMCLIPSYLALLQPAHLPTVHTVIVGGEACPVELARRWSNGRRLLNAYGPTEMTVVASVYEVENVQPDQERIPIGRPFGGTRTYILDEAMAPVPAGIAGETYLAGVNLSAGYLNRPEMNAEKFVSDPFCPGEQMYRTGDLARWLPDGTIELLGRIDHQIKLRGFRIELEEIENTLADHPGVRQAVVILQEAPSQPGGSAKQLLAYAAPSAEGEEFEDLAAVLMEHLRSRLPAYMLPDKIILLEAFPQAPGGKVNRRLLPLPSGAGQEYLPPRRDPRTPVEQGLAEIWRQVLHVDQAGPDDQFAELGGHSLRAAQLVSLIREVFQVDFPLRELFSFPTLGEMSRRVETLLAEKTAKLEPIRALGTQGMLPLSFAQQRLWFIDQLAPGSLFNNQPLAVRINGRLDVDALQRSLDEIVRRHTILRSRFIEQDGMPALEILPLQRVPIPLVDLSALPEERRAEDAARILTSETQRSFLLTEGPMLRALLVRLSAEEHIALLVMHHIASDGWSLGVLLYELSVLYAGYQRGGAAHPLPELPVQYSDYAAWQRSWMQGSVRQEQISYWKEQLAGLPPLLELPIDKPRPAALSDRGDTLPFELSLELSDQIREACKDEGVTLFMFLLAAFQVLLARYTGQDDIPVGTVVANRGRREIEGLIGFFVNTLVMRGRLPAEQSFENFLRQVREVCLGAYGHQDLPFEMLVEALQPERNLSHTPLFQVMFVLDPQLDEQIELPGLKITPIHQHTGASTFDLTISMVSTSAGLRGSVEFNTDLWDRESIRRMVENFTALLENLSEDLEQDVWRVSILSAAEQSRLIAASTTSTSAIPACCVHELVETQARLIPDEPALIFGGQVLTYAELNTRANQLAHLLRRRGTSAETLVAIAATRSIEMIVGLLAVLKAGGAYLPLDPNYPADRLAFMLEDSQAPVLLTQEALLDRLPAFSRQTILLDRGWDERMQGPAENPELWTGPDNLAYVIYTSGSTGRPKGTLLQHRGLVNLTQAQREAFEVAPGCRVLQFSPFSFDASVWETFMALANGAALVLAAQETLANTMELARLVRETRVTHATLPPSVLQVLPSDDLPDLRVVVAAGEACPASLIKLWSPGRKFFNAYGPTETTVCPAMYLCRGDEAGPPPIGRPLPNFRLYVCDRNRQMVPVGVPGELLVGGIGLARGYLNRPDLTAEKFIADTFGQAEPGNDSGRLYRTGDLVRFRVDGNIDFLGRIDQQVKVRGFRIELGEIEAVLLQHPHIQQAAIAAHTTGADSKLSDRLTAYVVLRPGENPVDGPQEWAAFLRRTLPDYMIPNDFVTLEAMPMTPSGKIDRRALPALESVLAAHERVYILPCSETERILAEMCARLLNLDQVGVTENFFTLGGHSLLATQWVSQIRQEFQVEIPLRSLFENPTIAGLAEDIELRRKAGLAETAPAIQRVSREAYRRKRTEVQ